MMYQMLLVNIRPFAFSLQLQINLNVQNHLSCAVETVTTRDSRSNAVGCSLVGDFQLMFVPFGRRQDHLVQIFKDFLNI